MKVIVCDGVFVLLEYRYRIDGKLWIDQKNFHSPFHSDRASLGGGTSSWKPIRKPVTLEV